VETSDVTSEPDAEAPRDLAPCGTYGAYQRHARCGEPVDDECRRARNEYMRSLRAARPSVTAHSQKRSRQRAEALALLATRHPEEYAEILGGILLRDLD
jgi:hypothetical protein